MSKDTSKRTYDGISFASELEMRFYRDVVLPKKTAGDIVYYELQKPYTLQPAFKSNGKNYRPIEYVADFFIRYKDGREVVIDTKGFPDAVAKLKRKMFFYLYRDVEYLWIGYSKIDGGWVPYEDILQGRKERKKEKRKSKESSKGGEKGRNGKEGKD